MLHWRVGRAAAPPAAGWLAASEADRLASLSAAPRRQQFLNARWALRELLGECFGCAPQTLELAIDSAGRSAWVQRPALCLSISHSGEWWAVAVADQVLGIDIERPNPARDRRELARLLLGDALPEDPRAMEAALLAEWCLREAWLKCHGLPLSALPGLRFRDAALPSMAAVQQAPDGAWTLALVSAALPPRPPLPPLPAGWRYFQPA